MTTYTKSYLEYNLVRLSQITEALQQTYDDMLKCIKQTNSLAAAFDEDEFDDQFGERMSKMNYIRYMLADCIDTLEWYKAMHSSLIEGSIEVLDR